MSMKDKLTAAFNSHIAATGLSDDDSVTIRECKDALLHVVESETPVSVTLSATLPGGFSVDEAKTLLDDLVRSHISKAMSGERMSASERDADLGLIRGVIVQAAHFVRSTVEEFEAEPLPQVSGAGTVGIALTTAVSDVLAERQRQQLEKGFSAEQDDTYTCGELAAAALSYIEPMEASSYWPVDWHDDSFKPSDERRNLVKAAALLLAEIERIDRAAGIAVKGE